MSKLQLERLLAIDSLIRSDGRQTQSSLAAATKVSDKPFGHGFATHYSQRS
ncbi:MAG: hypothetical protein AAGE96_03820 [Cyanobacteria bacterium P01_G01_bin.19]